jgi:peptidyl-prolyl cis-trans isomerase C
MQNLHSRSALYGAFLGSAATLLLTGFLACKGDKATSAAGGGKPASKGAVESPGLPAQSQAELNAPVAVIDGVTITVGELQERLNKQSPYVRARYTSLEQKKEFLDNMVRFEVLAKEASGRGFDKDPEVVRTMKQVMIQRLMREEFETKLKPEDIADADMKKFYEEHSAEYNKPEEVRVSAIIVKDKKLADKLAAEAKAQAPTDNKAFRDLVLANSQDDETKQRGGDLRFFTADAKDIPAPVVKAAFALQKAGETAGPIQTDKGFYVLKQTGRRPAIAKGYEEVKRQIQNRMYRDKRTKAMEDFVKGLREKAKVTIDEAALAKVRIDTSTAPGPTGGAAPPDDPHVQPQ